MSRKRIFQGHCTYRIKAWDYPWPAPGWENAVTVSIDPPLPLEDGTEVSFFGARDEQEARAKVEALPILRGITLAERKALIFSVQDPNGGVLETVKAERTHQLIQRLYALFPDVDAEELRLAAHQAWKEHSSLNSFGSIFREGLT